MEQAPDGGVGVRFEEALRFLSLTDKFRPDKEAKLSFYALYKQATSGDATGSRPGAFNFKARAKFDAWAEVKGLSSDEAMTQYVDYVNSLS